MTTDTVELTVPVSGRDHVRGPVGAPVALVEYGDFDCPFCAAAYVEVHHLLRRFPEDVRLVFRHNPRGELHPHAHFAAQAAEAAGKQGRFWEMHDALFERRGEPIEPYVEQWATSRALDVKRFLGDLHSAEVQRHIREDEIGGLRSGVVGTPTFFIDGRHYRDKPDLDGLSRAVLHRIRVAKPAR